MREVWKNVFEDLLSRPYSTSEEELDLEGQEMGVGEMDDEVLNRPVEVEEVWEALRRVREEATPGEDGVMGKWLKNRAVGEFIFELCHACFERGEIPAVWREGIIVPIPKKAEKAIPDPNGYRGISLLSAVYKVFCTVLRMRLESYLEGNQLLCEEQNGFRKRRSCIDNIMMLTMIGRKIIRGREVCLVALLV